MGIERSNAFIANICIKLVLFVVLTLLTTLYVTVSAANPIQHKNFQREIDVIPITITHSSNTVKVPPAPI